MIKPLKNYLVVIPDEAEKQTRVGVYVEKNIDEKPETGTVVAVGKKVTDIKVLDRILFKRYAPDSIEIKDTKYLILKDEDVAALIDKNDDVKGVGYGRLSDKKNHAHDILQPFNKDGKVNEQFVKVHGKASLKEALEATKKKI